MKKFILSVVGVMVLLAWLSLIAGMFMEIERQSWIIWVTTVALITEVAIWIVAGTLGVAVLQARKKIWKWLTGPFRKQDQSA